MSQIPPYINGKSPVYKKNQNKTKQKTKQNKTKKKNTIPQRVVQIKHYD